MSDTVKKLALIFGVLAGLAIVTAVILGTVVGKSANQAKENSQALASQSASYAKKMSEKESSAQREKVQKDAEVSSAKEAAENEKEKAKEAERAASESRSSNTSQLDSNINSNIDLNKTLNISDDEARKGRHSLRTEKRTAMTIFGGGSVAAVVSSYNGPIQQQIGSIFIDAYNGKKLELEVGQEGEQDNNGLVWTKFYTTNNSSRVGYFAVKDDDYILYSIDPDHSDKTNPQSLLDQYRVFQGNSNLSPALDRVADQINYR